MNFAIAVKALILSGSNCKLLLIRRRNDNPHSAGKWDIPGGRVQQGEDPIQALTRECMEETGLRIQVIAPIGVNHFVRDDGQTITMIVFICKKMELDSLALSDEHVEAIWVDLNRNSVPVWLHSCLDNFHNLAQLGIDIAERV